MREGGEQRRFWSLLASLYLKNDFRWKSDEVSKLFKTEAEGEPTGCNASPNFVVDGFACCLFRRRSLWFLAIVLPSHRYATFLCCVFRVQHHAW